MLPLAAWLNASEQHAFATLARVARSQSSWLAAHAAYIAADFAASAETYSSAQRCLMAWNDPIGRPNCRRCLAYSTASVTPTSSAVRAISFVGSEPVARAVYTEAARHGKRVQALGGAKNHIVVMPDADLELAVPAILGSAFGNAGQRCLAGSVVVAVGGHGGALVTELRDQAEALRVGNGMESTTDMGPVIRAHRVAELRDHIGRAEQSGAALVTDGRSLHRDPGFYLGPTILDQVTPEDFNAES